MVDFADGQTLCHQCSASPVTCRGGTKAPSTGWWKCPTSTSVPKVGNKSSVSACLREPIDDAQGKLLHFCQFICHMKLIPTRLI